MCPLTPAGPPSRRAPCRGSLPTIGSVRRADLATAALGHTPVITAKSQAFNSILWSPRGQKARRGGFFSRDADRAAADRQSTPPLRKVESLPDRSYARHRECAGRGFPRCRPGDDHRALRDDRAVLGLLVDEVHGGAGDPHAVLERRDDFGVVRLARRERAM